MAISVQWVEGFEALRRAMEKFGAAPQADPSADIFCTLPWFENLARHGLGRDISDLCLFLLVEDTDQGTLHALPLMPGAELEGLSNYYSSLFGPMVWETTPLGHSGAPVRETQWAVACRLLRQHPSRWPKVRLAPLDRDQAFYVTIRDALRGAGYWVDTYFCFGNWYLDVGGRSFATYFQTLPSALRHSITRGQARLTRKGKWDIRIHQQEGAELDTAIAAFEQVYSQSWKGREPNAAFIPGVARTAARQGWLRIGVLALDGQPVAAQLWLVKNGKASIYKLAYVAGFERYSPGSVLTAALMRHVLDLDQVIEVDYLTGDDAYKRDWMSHRRERWGVLAFDPLTLAGLWAALMHFGGRLVRWWRRTHPGASVTSRSG